MLCMLVTYTTYTTYINCVNLKKFLGKMLGKLFSSKRSVVEEVWEDISNFEQYKVSNYGRVVSYRLKPRLLVQGYNSQGIPSVLLIRDGKQHRRTVCRLVAFAFLDEPPVYDYDDPSVINLDGNRHNNHVTNLMWRPRWFATIYHNQFRKSHVDKLDRKIMIVQTQEVYDTAFEIAMRYGLLEKDILEIAKENTYFDNDDRRVWPTNFSFRLL